MALNDDIYTRVSQIYTEMGNTPEANAQIVRYANQQGLSAAQLSSALNVSEADIIRLASEAGVPFGTNVDTGSTGGTGGTGGGQTGDTGNGLGSNNNGVTLGGGGASIDLTTGDSGITVGGDSDVTLGGGLGSSYTGDSQTGDTGDGFNAEEYLTLYPDVAEAGIDPLEHYLNYGKAEGRSPNQAAFETQQSLAIENFKAALPENMRADYQFIVDNPQRFTADGQADVQAVADYLKDKGFTFEEAMQITGLPADHPLYSEAQTAYGVSEEDTGGGSDGDQTGGEETSPRQEEITRIYNEVFGRNPTSQEFNSWANVPFWRLEADITASAQTGGGSDVDAVDLSSLTDEQMAFANTLPSGLQDDYLAAVQAGLGDTASGLTLESLTALLKGRGLSFEQASQATGLTSDHPNYQASYDAWHGTAEEGDTGSAEEGDTDESGSGTLGDGPIESSSGNIVTGTPQVGEVNIMDYLGLQAGKPTLPAGTQLEPDLQQLEATDETLQALAPEQELATDSVYVATPSKITASTVTAPTPQDAVTATASTTDLVEQPEAAKMTAEKSLDQINKEADALQAARQDLNEIDPKATVQGQLALLQEQFAGGEIPVWASGAFRQVNALMAQRGIGGSTIAAESITNALMQSTIPIAQQDASFYQNVTIQNLSNEQQAEMAKFNARTSAIFNDQAAENAARSLNTQSENELSQFFTELSQNVALTNTAQTNAMEQFNATAENQMTQFFEELGLTADTFNADAINEMAQFNSEQANIIAQFNANMKNQREQFNVQNQLAIDASNVQWRRDVNTQNTAATNAALQFDAQNLLAVQQTALNNIWQHYDTLLSYAFTAEESSKERALNLTISSMNAEMQRQIAEDSSFLDSITGIVSGGATLLGSESGFKIAESWGLV